LYRKFLPLADGRRLDPPQATGTEEQIMKAFRATRREVETRVRSLLFDGGEL